MKRKREGRSVALSVSGTAVTLAQLRLGRYAGYRTAVVESRDPNELGVGDDVVNFAYYDRVTGTYSGEGGKVTPFTCEAADESGIFFVKARRIDDQRVVGRDGEIYDFRPGRDKIVAPRRLVACQLRDGTTKVVSADAVDNGNRGKSMLEKLSRWTVYYQVVSQLCGNTPVRLTPRIYIRGTAHGRAGVCNAEGEVPSTVRGRVGGRPDSDIVGFVRTTSGGDQATDWCYWAVYEDDVVQVPLAEREPADPALPTGPHPGAPDPAHPGTAIHGGAVVEPTAAE